MTYEPPIDVEYGMIKKLLNVGGVENLAEEIVQELIILLPCFVMKLRDNVFTAFTEFKEAKTAHDIAWAQAFLKAEGSVELRKMTANCDAEVIKLQQWENAAEANYERAKNAPNDWIELQQGLKRLCDVKYRKAGI